MSGALVHWDGRQWSAQTLGSADLVAMWARSRLDIWIGASDGTVFRGDGVSWSSAPMGASLIALWGADSQHVWASGPDGLHFFDGQRWTLLLPLPANLTLRAIWGISLDDVWAGGDQQQLLHWDGVAWTPALTPVFTQVGVLAVWGASTTDIWAGGFGGLLHWDGTQWRTPANAPSSSFPWMAFWGTGPGDVWAGSGYSMGTLAHWDGTNWAAVATNRDTRTMTGTGTDDVWDFGGSGQTLHWDGSSLTDLQSGPRDQLDSISAAGGERWAVGDNFSAVRWTGAQWSALTGPMTPPSIPTFLSVLVLAPDNVLVGYDGVYHWDGRSWTHPLSDIGPITTGLSASSANDIWGSRGWAGSPSFFPHFNGAGWEQVSTPPDNSSHLQAVHARAWNNVWVVGDDGTVYQWNGTAWIINQGGSWQSPHGPLSGGSFTGVWSSAPDDTWVVGSGMLAHWDGGVWTPLPNVPGLSRLWGRASDDVWAIGGNVALHWDGQTWNPVPLPEDLGMGAVTGNDVDLWLAGYNGAVLRYR